ncbi:MAG: hypothetical protein R3D00_08430 [Bacteroidia bacterium]
MKNLLFLLLLILSCSSAFAGEWDTNPQLWGIGVITTGDSSGFIAENVPMILPFGVDFPIYESPNGPVIGTIQSPGGENYQFARPVFILAGKTQKQFIDERDSREINYDASGLIFFEEKDGFLRILSHTLQKPAWIKIANLRACHLKPVRWMDHILQIGSSLFHPHDTIALNLRKSPSPSGEKITSMKGDTYLIAFTGNRQGLWAEVEVTLYDIHPCEGDAKIQNTWKGWVKLMDDAGFPNIWYYTGGC